MSSLAQIKRAIKVGTRVSMTNYGAYGPGDTVPWAGGPITLPFTRRVTRCQTNGLLLQGEGELPSSWLYWPPASRVSVSDERTFTLTNMRDHITYRIEDN